MDPFINYVVGKSYIQLGLYESFDAFFFSFQKLKNTPTRTFPIWIDRGGKKSYEILLAELQIIRNIKMKNWDAAQDVVTKVIKSYPRYRKNYYYQGVIAFSLKKYKRAAKYFETYLATDTGDELYDLADIAFLLNSYGESLYELGQITRFKDVATALLKDTKKVQGKNNYMDKVRERMSYLLIEIKASEKYDLKLEVLTKQFLKSFPKSQYQDRMNFLLGMSYIKNEKKKDGKNILKKILKDKQTSSYLKELVKSELALLKIKEKI